MAENAPVKAMAAVALKKITIETDGTVDGTTIKLNGEAITDLTSFYFSFYDSGSYENIGLSYTTTDPAAKPGELRSSTSFSLVTPRADASVAAAVPATASAAQPLMLQPSKVIPLEHLPPAASEDRRKLWAKV